MYMPYTGQQHTMTYYGSPKFPEDSFLLAGVSFNYNTCKNVFVDNILFCEKEPNNKFDPNAIKVTTQKGDLCGYIPKTSQEMNKNTKKLKVIDKKYHKSAYGIRVIPYFEK